MCRLLRVSPSGYYARQRRSPSPWAQDCQRLTAAIRTLHAESDGVYGSPKIWQILRTQGEGCGKYRMARLMRQVELQGIPAPARRKRRRSGARPAGITNQLARDFTAPALNAKWVTDITYSATQEGWLALSGGGPGFVFSPSDWVVDAAPAYAGSGYPSRVDGRLATEQFGARDPPFGSGDPVYRAGMSNVPQGSWHRE